MSPFQVSFSILCSLLIGGSTAFAQDVDVDSLDEGDFVDDVEEAEAIEVVTERQVAEENEILPDVVRAGYIQTMITDTSFLGSMLFDELDPYSSVGINSNWGLGIKLAAGYEFFESANISMAGEFAYAQAAYNAAGFGDGTSYSSPVQGDFRTHMVQVALKPTLILGRARRISLVGKIHAGVLYSGLLVSEELVVYPTVHDTPHPFGGAGLGIEYYSKLSHFSVMLAEAEFMYITGFDTALAFNLAGVKYTF